METRSEVWRLRRQNDLSQRRLLPSDEEHIVNRHQVEEAAKLLASRKEDRKQLLQQLACAFGRNADLIQYFIKINTSLPTLISLLSGHNAELQMEAMLCLTNMAAGSDEDSDLICKMAAPYLVTYLGGSNPVLQDQCAWCVGNLAADSQARASFLASLTVIHLLVQLLNSPSHQVVQSSAFALVNFAKTPKFLGKIVSENALPLLEKHLHTEEENHPVLTEVAWLVFYLTAKSECLDHIRQTQIPEMTTICFISVSRRGTEKYQIITPLVRSLGNMCSDLDLTSRVLVYSDILTQINEIINSAPDIHVRKESLWLLTNIAANPSHSKEIITAGLLKNIIHSLASTTDIKIQACLCLCNLLSHSTDYCELVCREGALQSLVPLLCHPHLPVVKTALWLTEILITNPEHLHCFVSSHGREALETLIRHGASDKNINNQSPSDTAHQHQVTVMARDLIAMYFKC